MRSLVKIITKKIAPEFYWKQLVYKKVVNNHESFLHQSGWYKSLVNGKPLSFEGKEIPWLNYGFFSFFSERLRNDLVLFEYGSGASTVYFSQKVKKVVSVEHDEQWYSKVSKSLPDNVSLVLQELDGNERYCRTIQQFNDEFDIVMVDGRDRVNCIKQSVGKLSGRGVIVLDNSNRDRYKEIFLWDGLKNFRHITFTGILPGGYKLDATTIFYREGNCLNI